MGEKSGQTLAKTSKTNMINNQDIIDNYKSELKEGTNVVVIHQNKEYKGEIVHGGSKQFLPKFKRFYMIKSKFAKEFDNSAVGEYAIVDEDFVKPIRQDY